MTRLWQGYPYQDALTVASQTQESAASATSSSATNVGAQALRMVSATTASTPRHQAPDGQPYWRKLSISKEFEISCAHQIPNHPGKCKRPHGHNYRFKVWMEGTLDLHTGMIEDFDVLTNLVNVTLVSVFDHQNLNEFYELPTAEVLATSWLTRLRHADPRFSKIEVWETSKCSATASV